jgi:histidinol-phosphate/aromatic aminotransferase/cobyric acid decarboxylase-like protein
VHTYSKVGEDKQNTSGVYHHTYGILLFRKSIKVLSICNPNKPSGHFRGDRRINVEHLLNNYGYGKALVLGR